MRRHGSTPVHTHGAHPPKPICDRLGRVSALVRVHGLCRRDLEGPRLRSVTRGLAGGSAASGRNPRGEDSAHPRSQQFVSRTPVPQRFGSLPGGRAREVYHPQGYARVDRPRSRRGVRGRVQIILERGLLARVLALKEPARRAADRTDLPLRSSQVARRKCMALEPWFPENTGRKQGTGLQRTPESCNRRRDG